MKAKRKYLVAVALLAVLAVVFGLAGTVTPMSEGVSPQESSSSDSVAHFQNPPTYDSDWVDITDKCGQYFNITHNLNSTDSIVDINGKATPDGGIHQKHLGGTDFVSGWNETYGAEHVDQAHAVVQTNDLGYLVAGWTYSDNYDAWVVRTDAHGKMLWNKTYGGVSNDDAMYITQTLDGGYAITGHTLSFGAISWDWWLVKTNSTGNMLWSRRWGGIGDERSQMVVQTPDIGYAICGSTSSLGQGNHDWWLIKTDVFGNMLWNRTYGGIHFERAYSVLQTIDGGYAIAGRTDSVGAGNGDFWLIKTDQFGNAYSNFHLGLAWTDSTADTITLYRGTTDPYWNYLRVRIWSIEEPTWQFGDINQDGVVDVNDLAIISRNYGKTFSALSLGGIAAVAGIYAYKKRKQPK